MPIKPALVLSDPDHVNWENIILLAGVLVSVVTFVVQSMITRDQDRTTRRLEMLNLQLGSVYGPLQGRLDAASNGKQSARFSLKQKRLVPREQLYKDEKCTVENPEFRWFGYGPDGEPVAQKVEIVLLWRRWVREVVQPNNEAMLDILLNNTHLLVLEASAQIRSWASRSLAESILLRAAVSLVTCLRLSLLADAARGRHRWRWLHEPRRDPQNAAANAKGDWRSHPPLPLLPAAHQGVG